MLKYSQEKKIYINKIEKIHVLVLQVIYIKEFVRYFTLEKKCVMQKSKAK